jgi:large conductance mechanosensitive channel
VPEPKEAKNRLHFDLRAPPRMDDEVGRLETLGATVLRRDAALTVMHLSRRHRVAGQRSQARARPRRAGPQARTQDVAGNHRGPGWLAAVPDGPGSRAITMTRQSQTAETLAPRHDHRNRTAYLVTPPQMRPIPHRAPSPEGKTKGMKGFRNFLMRGDVIVVAVGLVIALAFSGLITAFTTDIINPIVSRFQGGKSLGLGVQLGAADNPKTFVDFGSFISAIIYFCIFIVVVYFLIVVPYKHVQARRGQTVFGDPTPVKTCPACLSSDLPAAASKCKYCGTDQLAVPAS